MEQDWKRAKGPFALIFGPPAFWLLLFFVVPLAVIWTYSFGRTVGLTEIDITGTFANYIRAFDPVYLQIFAKSVGLAALTTLICLVVGFPVALAISFAPDRAKAWLLLLIMLPFWTNLLIRTFAIMEVIRAEGVINTVLLWAGVIERPLAIIYTDTAVLIGMAYVYLPLMVLPLFAAIDRFDMRLLEAGYDLYASRWQVLRRIILPIVKPGIVAGSILVFVPSLGAYVTPRVLGGGKNMMIGNFIELQFLAGRNWPLGAALSVTLLVIVTVALLFYVRAANRGSNPHG